LFLVIIIVGILNSIGLLILGVPHAIFFGFLAGFLILIPYIGILIGSLFPALLSIVTMDSPWYAVGVIGVMSFVQFLEGNFITPNIVGSKVSVNPMAAIVALFLGGQLWGLSGLILALPVTAILKVILDTIPSLEPFGFLLGEPVQKRSRRRLYKKKYKRSAPGITATGHVRNLKESRKYALISMCNKKPGSGFESGFLLFLHFFNTDTNSHHERKWILPHRLG
jgi:hypothetical protein